MSQFKVVVTDDRFGGYLEEEAVLKEIDARIDVHNFKTDKEAIQVLSSADAVLNNLYPLGGKVIGKMAKCRIISRYGVGYDNVDVEAATKAGIWVSRVPDYSLEVVSDQALALLLGCIIKIAYKDRRIRQGAWNLTREQPAHRIKGHVLGLVGYGAIGRVLHRKTAGLGLSRVLVCDPFLEPGLIREAGAHPVDFDTLLKESDYISIHVPLLDQTRGMIGAREVSLMKKEVILINTSRGPIINEKAICRALKEGRINYAGLDVFKKEPLPADSPLRELDNVIFSDHTGYYSEESLVELKTKAARNIVEVLQGGKPIYPVNQVKPG